MNFETSSCRHSEKCCSGKRASFVYGLGFGAWFELSFKGLPMTKSPYSEFQDVALHDAVRCATCRPISENPSNNLSKLALNLYKAVRESPEQHCDTLSNSRASPAIASET